MDVREKEVELIRRRLKIFIVLSVMFWSIRNFISITVLVTMTLCGITLTPGNVFAGISAINLLSMSIRFIPDIINYIIQSLVSFKRVQDFLRCKEVVNYVHRGDFENAIEIKESSFAWEVPEENTTGELQETKTILKKTLR